MLAVTTPATDRSLLTIDELRAATGVATGSAADLAALGARVAAAITRGCLVAAAAAVPPTLRQETLTETFRPPRPVASLTLSRRPVVAVTSIVMGEVALDTDGFEVEGTAGLVRRLCGDRWIAWPCSKIVVVYDAGWAMVPDDLKLAASKLAALLWSSQGRDALLKRERIDSPGVDETEREYWVGPVDGAALPADVTDLLAPYTNVWV